VLAFATGLVDGPLDDLKAAQRLAVKIPGQATPPPSAIGAVPETAICGPTRTAREKPIFGS
jgi:hypothetical protein